jgi:hypothetical protein
MFATISRSWENSSQVKCSCNTLVREDVMEKHGLGKTISISTARRYLNELGYWWVAIFVEPKFFH